MFALRREPAFLVNVGDSLRFDPIDRATFDRLAERVGAGEIVARREFLP